MLGFEVGVMEGCLGCSWIDCTHNLSSYAARINSVRSASLLGEGRGVSLGSQQAKKCCFTAWWSDMKPVGYIHTVFPALRRVAISSSVKSDKFTLLIECAKQRLPN